MKCVWNVKKKQMICKYTKQECVYDEWADMCHSHCNQITISEIERQKKLRETISVTVKAYMESAFRIIEPTKPIEE